MKQHRVWALQDGEILNQSLHRNIQKKYQADTPFDNRFVPYLIMIFCALVDGFVFYSLFSRISYDSPTMMGIQIAGFLFGFDVVPIYLGIHYRRLRQGLTTERFVMVLALIVCTLAFTMNVALRITTIDQMSPDLSDMNTSYYGTVEQQEEDTDTSADPTAIALTIFGIGIPVVTSLGSFFISYMTYNPLLIKKRRLEEMIEDTRDEVRRLEAILDDYDAEEDFDVHLVEDDDGKFKEMEKMQRAVVLSACAYVRERLKEHLGNPTANTVLSEDYCEEILKQLDRGIACLDALQTETPQEQEQTEIPGEEMQFNTVTPVSKATA